MFKVVVQLNQNTLRFTFRELCDALKFIGDCIETAECCGTEVTIYEED